MTKLSPHFTLEEFCASQTASRLGINNELPAELYATAKNTCKQVEEVRLVLRSNPVLFSSGYRCLALNRLLKSKDDSQHTKAEAVDFTCPTFGSAKKVFEAVVASPIKYDQIILEFDKYNSGWVHISFGPLSRQQALIIDQDGVRKYK